MEVAVYKQHHRADPRQATSQAVELTTPWHALRCKPSDHWQALGGGKEKYPQTLAHNTDINKTRGRENRTHSVMEQTIRTYRDEIANISSLITLYLEQNKETHYSVRSHAYDPNPYISVITKDIDYIDGTTLSSIVEIVEQNHKDTWYTYHVNGCKIIVTTESGTMIDAYGMKLTFTFYEHSNEESK